VKCYKYGKVILTTWKRTMEKKYKIAKSINILVCMGIVVAIMLCAYNAWSLNGKYTTFSFFASLVMHGGLGIIIL